MLKISTYLDRSTIHGIGVFAAEAVTKGTEIWIFNPKIDMLYTQDQWEDMLSSLSPQSLMTVRRYSYKEDGHYCLCLDNAQFMNHCPNEYNVGNDQKSNVMFARKSIKAGEELLCNYFEYSDPDDFHIECISGLKTDA